MVRNVVNSVLTLALSYYESPDLLAHHLDRWGEYPNGVRVIIVDDGSKVYPASDLLRGKAFPIPVELFRVLEDIPQNTIGARNLAFDQAQEGWVWCTDIDHVVSVESMKNLIELGELLQLDPKRYYVPARMNGHIGKLMKRHRDSFIMTKQLFWRAGGYDESLRAFYFNGPWYHFRRRLNKVATKQEIDTVWSLYYGTIGFIPQSERKTLNSQLMDRRPRNLLQFNWEKIEL